MARLIAFFGILLFVSTVHSTPCPIVAKHLVPCLLFVKGSAKAPSPACCTGIKDLTKTGLGKAEKQALCICLKKILVAIGPYEPKTLSLLPKKCGLKLVLPPIDKKFDCAKFKLGYEA